MRKDSGELILSPVLSPKAMHPSSVWAYDSVTKGLPEPTRYRALQGLLLRVDTALINPPHLSLDACSSVKRPCSSTRRLSTCRRLTWSLTPKNRRLAVAAKPPVSPQAQADNRRRSTQRSLWEPTVLTGASCLQRSQLLLTLVSPCHTPCSKQQESG